MINELAELKIGLIAMVVLLALFNMPELVRLVEHVVLTAEELVFLFGLEYLF